MPDAERWFPTGHLAASTGWTGVPSGLVVQNGTYHAFYQHNPNGDSPSGAVDWAHATSTDLVNWTDATTYSQSYVNGAIPGDTSGTWTDTNPGTGQKFYRIVRSTFP